MRRGEKKKRKKKTTHPGPHIPPLGRQDANGGLVCNSLSFLVDVLELRLDLDLGDRLIFVVEDLHGVNLVLAKHNYVARDVGRVRDEVVWHLVARDSGGGEDAP